MLWLKFIFSFLLLNWTVCKPVKPPTKNKIKKLAKIRGDFKKMMDDHDNDKNVHFFFSRIDKDRVNTSKIF